MFGGLDLNELRFTRDEALLLSGLSFDGLKNAVNLGYLKPRGAGKSLSKTKSRYAVADLLGFQLLRELTAIRLPRVHHQIISIGAVLRAHERRCNAGCEQYCVVAFSGKHGGYSLVPVIDGENLSPIPPVSILIDLDCLADHLSARIEAFLSGLPIPDFTIEERAPTAPEIDEALSAAGLDPITRLTRLTRHSLNLFVADTPKTSPRQRKAT